MMRSCQLTDDYRGLLAAVCREPEEDTPRLVMADYLDENGWPERAKFIRLSIEAAKRRGKGKYGIEEDQLIWSFGCEFATEVASIFGRYRHYEDFNRNGANGWRDIRWEWARGFVSEIWLPGELFLELGDKIVANVPIQKVNINQSWADWSVQESALFLRLRTRLNPEIPWPRGAEIPREIWNRLKGGRLNHSRRVYTGTSDHWRNDLSQACLSWAREKAFVEAATTCPD